MVPGLKVDAPITQVGVDSQGQLEVPNDGDVVGWYRWSAAPGKPGNTVLAGHVDTRADGPGALFDLGHVKAGDRVRLQLSDGSARDYEVTSLQTYRKQELPGDDVFARQGPSQLVVVTCGGSFNRSTRSYDSNVVVIARPIG